MAKNKTRPNRAKQRKIAQIKTDGGVIPVGLFGGALPAAQVAERMAHLRSGAAGAHADSNIRSRQIAAGRTNRVGSRSAARAAAVRDWS